MLHKACALLLLFAATSHTSAFGQITINEASSRNAHTVADAVGDHHDWVELYNAGAAAVNLAGYTLSDDPLQPARWTFPVL